MFTSFENLKSVATKVATKVGTTCHVHGNNIVFARDNRSRAYLGIVYSPLMMVAYNTFSLQGETPIVDAEQLERMLRREVAAGC